MGIEYQVMFFEDFDWNHKNKSKKEYIGNFREAIPHAELVGRWYGWLIFDVGKTYVCCDSFREKLKQVGFVFDLAFYIDHQNPIPKQLYEGKNEGNRSC